MKSGWLAFQTDRERRRLAPVPDGWEALDDDHLKELLKRASESRPLRRLIE